jgi:glycosyltransferase involved in cell wall biosynthesis
MDIMNSKKKHLLMISYPFPPNSTAGAVRSERFARYLPGYNWVTDVVTIKPREDLFKDSTRLKALGENVTVHFTSTVDPWLWARERTPKNILIRAIRSLIMKIFSFPDHMLLWVPFAVRQGLKINRDKPFDAIYTTSPPHSTHLAGLLLSKILKKPWIADFRDPWTLNAYLQKGKIQNILLRVERLLERLVYRNASVIIANTRANRRNLLDVFPWIKAEKVLYLPNGWEAFPRDKITSQLSEHLTIVHAGTFYPRFKPYALLHALAEWKEGRQPANIPALEKNIRILILGSKDEETRRIVNQLEIQEIVEFMPWVALDEARRIMCQADLLWATLGTGKESSTYVPSKLFEYIAAGKPILGFFPAGEAEGLIRDARAGRVFTSDDPLPIIEFLNESIGIKRLGIKGEFSVNESMVDSLRIDNLVKKLAHTLDCITGETVSDDYSAGEI